MEECEEIEGQRAMDFARSENARSLPRLQSDPRYEKLFADALAIAICHANTRRLDQLIQAQQSALAGGKRR